MTCICTILYVQFVPWTKLSLMTQLSSGGVCVIKFFDLRRETQLIPRGFGLEAHILFF
jgi:hypothetical protein